MTQIVPTATAEDIMAKLESVRRTIAETVEVNGRPLGNAVRINPASKGAGDPIEVIILPPDFEYAGNCFGPSSMALTVVVVAVASDLTVANLIALERGVADAIDSRGDSVVRSSSSGVWRKGSVDCPAYLIAVEVDNLGEAE